MKNNWFSVSAIVVSLLVSTLVNAAPWANFGRTYPVPRYHQDEGFAPQYKFGIQRTYDGYVEPDFYEALSLPSPLESAQFKSYNLIIVINDNEHSTNSSQWGPPQTMRVYSRAKKSDKGLLYFWAISTGMDRASTKKGYYRPQSFSSRHWSSQFDAPMLSSVFFDGGKALHSSLSTDDLALMGVRRSSHGCVHVEDNRAEELFHLIGHSGYGPVDLISRNGKLVRKADGSTEKVNSYKTLIIIH